MYHHMKNVDWKLNIQWLHVHCAHLHRYTTISSYMGQHHISKSSHLVACCVRWTKVLLYTMFAVLYAKVVASLTSEVSYLISDVYSVDYKV